MNNFYEITYQLNEYGAKHPQFVEQLRTTILNILSVDKIYYTYSVANIIYEHVCMEAKGKAKIKFIDLEVLLKLRQAIAERRQDLQKERSYEGALYENGLFGVYEELDKDIFKYTGIHIAKNDDKPEAANQNTTAGETSQR